MPSSFDRRNQPPYLRVLRAIRRRWQTARTTEIFVGSFALMILLGTFGFKTVPGLYTGEPLTWTQAFFTATSGACVNGMQVVDTATFFTFKGQLFLLVLVQIGGVGMMSLATMLIAALGGRPSLRSEAAATLVHPSIDELTPRQLVTSVIKFTFFFEAVGALALYLTWGPRLGWRDAIWPSIFHSICAFCNAGFSTNSDSLVRYTNSPATLLIIGSLVLLGGLGFIVVEELALYSRKPRNQRRTLSLHTKLVLSTTMVITLTATALFLVFEWNESLKRLSYVDRMCTALFLSITPRSGGFNVVDYTTMSDSTNFLTILLMMIGGSPGSTAGGLKTTSVAILGLLAWSRLRGRRAVTFANRSIPEETVQRAVGLLVGCGGIVIVGIFLLAGIGDFYGQDDPFLTEMFEVTSAFNTSGLSMNVTHNLSPHACWVLILLMFIGRVGPLSFAAVLRSQFAQRGDFRYAHEDVVVG